jgi:hypothetical protein
MNPQNYFKLCSTCKTPIAYRAKYYRCSVSTCNKKVTALYFCSVPCWDAHVPDARHRDAWAEVETAPESAERDDTSSTSIAHAAPARRVVSGRALDTTSAAAEANNSDVAEDVLVVMSKLKAYVKGKSEMRTSDGVSEPLSDHLRRICTQAIRSAATNNRTTVLARDIEAAIQGGTASE